VSSTNKSDRHYITITQLSQNTKFIAKCDVTPDFRYSEVNSIQHYVIKFSSNLLQVVGFLGVYSGILANINTKITTENSFHTFSLVILTPLFHSLTKSPTNYNMNLYDTFVKYIYNFFENQYCIMYIFTKSM